MCNKNIQKLIPNSTFLYLSVVFSLLCFSIRPSLSVGPSKEEYENNRVVVRVWHSEGVGGNSVGHVSLQMPRFSEDDGGYVSFWPTWAGGVPQNMTKYLTMRTSGGFNCLRGDYASEEKPPSTIVSLYTLDITKMRDEFLKFKSKVLADPLGRDTGWCLTGDCIFSSNGSQHSCASLALELLSLGGIRDLFSMAIIPAFQRTPDSLFDKIKTKPIVVAPNTVADIVLRARVCERVKSDLIQTIPFYQLALDLSDIEPFFNKNYLESESPYGPPPPQRFCAIS